MKVTAEEPSVIEITCTLGTHCSSIAKEYTCKIPLSICTTHNIHLCVCTHECIMKSCKRTHNTSRRESKLRVPSKSTCIYIYAHNMLGGTLKRHTYMYMYVHCSFHKQYIQSRDMSSTLSMHYGHDCITLLLHWNAMREGTLLRNMLHTHTTLTLAMNTCTHVHVRTYMYTCVTTLTK